MPGHKGWGKVDGLLRCLVHPGMIEQQAARARRSSRKCKTKPIGNRPQAFYFQRIKVQHIRPSLCKTNPIPGGRGQDIRRQPMPRAGTQTSTVDSGSRGPNWRGIGRAGLQIVPGRGTVQLRAFPGGNRGAAPTTCSLWLLNGLAFDFRLQASVSRLKPELQRIATSRIAVTHN
jgi:hypothetical protein